MTAAPTLSHDRHGRITGSRVAGILGLSPYNSREDVLREMVREYHWAEPEFTGNIATRWGHEHEAEAISAYEFHTGKLVAAHGPAQVTLIHPKYPFLAVTPDGLVGKDGMVEAKCPFCGSYTCLDDRPDHEAQVQLQLAVADRLWCDYVVWRPKGICPPDRAMRDDTWLARHIDELTEFIEQFRTIVEDDALSAPFLEPLVNWRTDPEWADAAYFYLEAKADEERAAKAAAEAKATLVKLAGDKSARGSGVYAIRNKAKAGQISYAKAIKELLPDANLEKYRGEPTAPSFTIRRTGEK